MVAREFRSWSAAMERALYGPAGFYRGGTGPAAHFRTSVHASPLFAGAIARLLTDVDAALGRPNGVALADVGAGRGELLTGVLDALAEGGGDLAQRVRLIGVEVAERPDGLPARIEWHDALPSGLTGLLVANEWLDNVPCDIAMATADGGWLEVEVTTDGAERLGGVPDAAQLGWLAAWWPHGEAETRAEIGTTRDAAWLAAVGSLERGVAVAIDYAHTKDGRPPYGTLSGYRQGRQVDPVPDGSCDITCHVALDACAAATASVVDWSKSYPQRAALHRLGITGNRPPLTLASSDPRGYLRALSQASSAAELTDPAGLGGFGWLVQGVGVAVPDAFGPDQP